ncbi:MAG: class I SAM-dependent methyltransferase [Microgenomates group bacterium]
MSATHNYFVDTISHHFGGKKISIIDFGCGSGDLLNFISPNTIKKYQGFDINKNAIVKANANHKNKNFSFKIISPKTIVNFGKKNSVDTIVLIGVIQYLSDRELEWVLSESLRTLTKDGIFILSCAVDHSVYRFFNLYRFFIPHHFVHRNALIRKLETSGFDIISAKERGLLIAPFFSNILVLFFDAFDQLFLKTKGELGPVGKSIRAFFAPIIAFEHTVSIDFGHTLFVTAQKKSV